MSAWSEYLDLLDELGGLAAREAQDIADADSRYQQESRRLQSVAATAERDHKKLADRNAQVQMGIRSLTRQLDVAVPSGSTQQTLTGAQLADALKSAEYDLEQMRRSLTYIESQRPPFQVSSAPAAQTAPTPTTAAPPDQPASAPRATNRTAIGISLAAMLVIFLIIAVVAL